MDAIVAVYEDWGIGCCGTQPVALSADRKFFRQTTKGACVIVGRRTMEDFPGKKPLPGRENILLTRGGGEFPGFTVCASPQEAAELVGERKAFVIGGGSVYAQMLPFCKRVFVTKVYVTPKSDTFFCNLDASPDWKCTECVQQGEENGVKYEMLVYERV